MTTAKVLSYGSAADFLFEDGKNPLAATHVISQEHVLSTEDAKEESSLSGCGGADMGIVFEQSIHDRRRDTDVLDRCQLALFDM